MKISTGGFEKNCKTIKKVEKTEIPTVNQQLTNNYIYIIN